MIAPWIDVDSLEDPSSSHAQDAVEAASYVLWVLSGRKYGGVASTTETYCQMGLREIGLDYRLNTLLATGRGDMYIWPELRDGVITNRIGGFCSACGCSHLIRLRGGPVISVQSVHSDDHVVSLADVAIFDYSYITSPDRCWSTCGDVQVSYTFGAPPPVMGQMAARELANQYVLALTGDDACALPQRVTQVSRQGVSWTLLDPQDFLDKGLTGIYGVDLFLRAVNPHKAQMRSRVFSPDVPRGKTRRGASAAEPGVSQSLMSAGGELFGMNPVVAPAMSPVSVGPMPMLMEATPQTYTATAPVQSVQSVQAGVGVYEGRPLRWVVPGSFGSDSPPVISVQPSGREVPPDALLWRNGNYTLDLTAEQVEQLLPPGSALVVSPQADAATTNGQTSYPVERRTQ